MVHISDIDLQVLRYAFAEKLMLKIFAKWIKQDEPHSNVWIPFSASRYLLWVRSNLINQFDNIIEKLYIIIGDRCTEE